MVFIVPIPYISRTVIKPSFTSPHDFKTWASSSELFSTAQKNGALSTLLCGLNALGILKSKCENFIILQRLDHSEVRKNGVKKCPRLIETFGIKDFAAAPETEFGTGRMCSLSHVDCLDWSGSVLRDERLQKSEFTLCHLDESIHFFDVVAKKFLLS